jgi:hypothetical protein
MEKLLFEKVCQNEGEKNIEKVLKGFGKGFSLAADLFNEILLGLNALRESKNMRVIILCHATIKKFEDPTTNTYDRYQMKLCNPISRLLSEWADVIGFCQQEMATKVQKSSGFDGERVIPIDLGTRVLRLNGTASYDAGNRYDLPASIPLVWSEYETALNKARGI